MNEISINVDVPWNKVAQERHAGAAEAESRQGLYS